MSRKQDVHIGPATIAAEKALVSAQDSNENALNFIEMAEKARKKEGSWFFEWHAEKGYDFGHENQ